MWHIIKGALTQINMWYHQACMELWPVIQNSLNDIPVFQGDSYIYWLFLTPEQKCLTSLNFSADPCNRRSLMAAWKETHHPQAAAEVTKKMTYSISWTRVATFEVKGQSHQLSSMSQQCIIYLLYSKFDFKWTDSPQLALSALERKTVEFLCFCFFTLRH